VTGDIFINYFVEVERWPDVPKTYAVIIATVSFRSLTIKSKICLYSSKQVCNTILYERQKSAV